MKRVVLIICLLAFTFNFAAAETKRGVYIKDKKTPIVLLMPPVVLLIYKIIKEKQ